MHGLTLETFDHLVALAYQAGCDPTRWPEFLAALDAHVDGAYLSIYGYDTQAKLSLGEITTRYPDDLMVEYANYFATVNPYPALLVNTPVMGIHNSRYWIPRNEFLSCEFYNDFLSRPEPIGSGGGGVLFNDDGRILVISGHVRLKDEDKTTPRLIGTLRLLAPHIRRAFEMQRSLQGQALETASYAEALNRIRNSVFLLDSRGRVTFCNTAGASALKRHAGLWQDRCGTLEFGDANARKNLQDGMACINRRTHDPGTASFVVPVGVDQPVAATLFPFFRDPDLPPAAAMMPPPGTPVAMLVLMDADLDRQSVCRHLRNLHCLTEAEQAIAIAIADGQTISGVAESSDVSRHTLRNQLKSVYTKTGVNSQAQLAALVNRLAF